MILSPHHQRNFSADYWMIPATFMACFAVFYFNMPVLLDDPDLPWRLANGRWILRHQAVPMHDPWSFASNNAPWVNHHWLWDFVLGIADQIGGLFGVLVFICGFAAACIAFLTSRLLWLGLRRGAIILTLIAATIMMIESLSTGSHIGGYAFLLLFHALLHETRTTWRCGRMVILPPLMALWANTADNFPVAFTLMLAYFIEALATRHFDWASRMLLVAVACAGAALLTPFGVDAMLLRMETLLNDSYRAATPFTFTADFALSLWMLLFIYASNVRAPHAGIADKLIAMFWATVTLFTTLSGTLFMLVSVPYMAACFDDQTRGLRNMQPPSSLRKLLSHIPAANLWFACFILTAGFVYNAHQQPHDRRLQQPKDHAADAIAYAAVNHSKRNFLAEESLGAEAIYRTKGKLAIFMDSRGARAYGPQAMKDYRQIVALEGDWQQLLKIYGIDGMLLKNNSAFAKAYENGQYRKNWQLMFAGKAASVYIARP